MDYSPENTNLQFVFPVFTLSVNYDIYVMTLLYCVLYILWSWQYAVDIKDEPRSKAKAETAMANTKVEVLLATTL